MKKLPSYQSLEISLKNLKTLIDQLKHKKNYKERLHVLDSTESVQDFFKHAPYFQDLLTNFTEADQYTIKSLLALGQGPIIFQDKRAISEKNIMELIEKLNPVEKFYDRMGGIIGYHAMMLQLILEKECIEINECQKSKEHYLKPPGYDITKPTPLIRKAIRKTLESLKLIADIYPVGGAGDRLKLRDEITGEDLPSAELLFEGKTLLEGLIRDLQAREYLYYKLFDKQLFVPVALMTSDEKSNHEHIVSTCQHYHWFGRPRDSYILFKQPLVPVLTEDGNWAVSESMKILFKPGGHGVMWKLALDAGVLDSLIKKGCSKVLVRQINNPVASTDDGLLAFCGLGLINNYSFGFASCPRLLNTAEGMNVLIEKQIGQDYEYGISNIEYPDFVKKDISDVSECPGSPYSAFPANTNILFADLQAIKKAVQKNPVPGMLINMKMKVECLTIEGFKKEVLTGRLESLMQNVADAMTQHFSKKQDLLEAKQLNTYLTYNVRRKTISVTKKLHANSDTIIETPEGCYYDQLLNHHELFSQFCKFTMPKLCDEQEYLKYGPSFVTAFHPALGPLYSIIAQKIQHGQLQHGAELMLEIAELEIRHLNLSGSLLIEAENVVGHKDSEGLLHYSNKVGRCILKNVDVKNGGIDREKTEVYWKRQIQRHESLRIYLHGHSEFVAENVTFSGDWNIEVPDGYRVTARELNGKLVLDKEPFTSIQAYWNYSFDDEDFIQLKVL